MTILATLSVLALIEHWLLAIPLPADTLWRWTRRTPAAAAGAEQRDASSGMARAKPLYGAAGAGQAL
jgi:hypothetical protein